MNSDAASTAALLAALDTLIAYTPNGKPPTDPAVVAATKLLMANLDAVAASHDAVFAALVKAQQDYTAGHGATSLVPTREHRISSVAPLARVLVRFADAVTRRLPVAGMQPSPAAAAFPGSVPAGAAPVIRTTSIDLSTPGWHSLGLYAAPAAAIKVSFGGVVPANVAIRIGAQTDDIVGLDAWERMPRISREFPVTTTSVTVANAYGGLVYVEVLRAGPKSTLAVTVTGAVASPLFLLGSTTLADWQAQLAALATAAPWAEIGTPNVVLTVPRAEIAKLADPTALLQFWDQAMQAADDLAALDFDPKRAQRYVTDLQISDGGLHSGYPIMAHLYSAATMVDLHAMKAGPWGLFHELGHNHQERAWTFAGGGEVTVNIFSLYLCETLCGVPWDKAWGGNLADAKARLPGLLAAGEKPWHDDDPERGAVAAMRLLMYSQLQRAFGWEAYIRVFAKYRALSPGQQPKTDAEKVDLWCRTFSLTVNRDLGPFFSAWGLPVSQQVRADLAYLWDWMPPDWPGYQAPTFALFSFNQVSSNTSVSHRGLCGTDASGNASLVWEAWNLINNRVVVDLQTNKMVWTGENQIFEASTTGEGQRLIYDGAKVNNLAICGLTLDPQGNNLYWSAGVWLMQAALTGAPTLNPVPLVALSDNPALQSLTMQFDASSQSILATVSTALMRFRLGDPAPAPVPLPTELAAIKTFCVGPDGTLYLVAGTDAIHLWSWKEGATPVPIYDLSASFINWGWHPGIEVSADGGTLYFMNYDSTGTILALYSGPVTGGPPTLVFNPPNNYQVGSAFALSGTPPAPAARRT